MLIRQLSVNLDKLTIRLTKDDVPFKDGIPFTMYVGVCMCVCVCINVFAIPPSPRVYCPVCVLVCLLFPPGPGVLSSVCINVFAIPPPWP